MHWNARAHPSGVLQPARNWLEWLARWGFIANALVYLVIGALAMQWALGEGGRITDPDGAFMSIRQATGGNGLLIALSIGFLSYALWRVLAAVFDGDGDGSSASGVANRVFSVIKGCAYAALGIDAIHLALGSSGGGSSWSGRVLASAVGPALVLAVGAAVFAFACYEMYRAYSAQLSKGLRLYELGSRARAWVVGMSRFGIAARALVIGAFGVLMVRAVLDGHHMRTPRTTESIRVAGQSEPLLYLLIGAGLVAYGIYLVVLSKYRQVRVG